MSERPSTATRGQRAVLVTGAGSGIGRKITERLAATGNLVYAGVRKDSDVDALRAIENVQPLRLDVTNVQDIAAAVDEITKKGSGLYGLINNAGVATIGSVVDADGREFDLVMAVNAHGPYYITRAFAPFIIGAKGRIINIGSISGILAEKYLSAYSMSKHAIEAFTDSLAMEMEPLEVKVSVIEPGNFNTDIVKNFAGRIGADMVLQDLSKLAEPDDVAAAVLHALFDPQPRRRYVVVLSEQEARKTIKKQIEQLVQLNEGSPYAYGRQTLISMLEEALLYR